MNITMEIEEGLMHSASSNDVDKQVASNYTATSKKLDNLALNTNKAGMQDIDTAKINEIIKKASEGSRFYQHKQQAQQKLDTKIEEMLQTAKTFSTQQIQSATDQMEHAAQQFEAARDLSRTIVHVDMDMFFAAVEMRDDPNLRDVPMAVGCSSMLSTSNYAARKFGVRAAMPGFIAQKLCPQLVLVSPNFSKYKAASAVVEEVFAAYDPSYVMMSLDEAYLDITQFMEANRDAYVCCDEPGCSLPEVVVSEMRRKIEEATNLTASAGIAANTRLAKVCSDLNKPNGQYFLPPHLGTINNFVHTLSIRKISGIGNVMEQQLKALDIRTCGDLRPKYGLLRLLFSDTCLSYFVRISLGVGETDLTNMASGERKSMSTETTFTGTTDRPQLLELLAGLCRDLHEDLLRKRLMGKVVTVKMKTVDFALRTRSLCLGEATQDVAVMTSVSRKILIQEMQKCPRDKPLALRLLGVRMSTLSDVTEGGQKQASIIKMFAKCNDASVSRIERKTDVDLREFCDSRCSESTSDQGERDDANEQNSENVPKAAPFICPVCDEVIATKFLKTFNNHLDECLNKSSLLDSSKLVSKNLLEAPEEFQSMTDNRVAAALPWRSTVGEAINNGNTASTRTGFGKDCLVKHAMDTEIISATKSPPGFSVGINGAERQLSQFTTVNDEATVGKLSLLFPEAEVTDNAGPSLVSFAADVETDSQSLLCVAVKTEQTANQSLLCPVCNTARFPSSLALNSHLDDCLSLQEVASLQRPSDGSRPKHSSSAVQTLTKKRKSDAQANNGKKHKTSQNHSITKYLT